MECTEGKDLYKKIFFLLRRNRNHLEKKRQDACFSNFIQLFYKMVEARGCYTTAQEHLVVSDSGVINYSLRR